jgi:DNA invertase Pin-like site-specific DNA recombinase
VAGRAPSFPAQRSCRAALEGCSGGEPAAHACVSDEFVYLDHGMTGRNRARPGLEQAIAAVREGDTVGVPNLARLARSVPDGRQMGESLAARGVPLSPDGTVYDPNDPMGWRSPRQTAS